MQDKGASCVAPDLQAQIDETLEKIKQPALESLVLPLGDEYLSKREDGLQGVCNILRVLGGAAATAIFGEFTCDSVKNL